MYIKKSSSLVRIILIILCISMLLPANVYASSGNQVPRASYYLDSYNTYLYNAAWGRIRVYFNVTGVNYMDEIGTLSIQIYESTDNENWTWVETYKYNTTSGMLGYNKVYYSNYIVHSGTIGRYYKAYVCIWAGKDGDGDTRYMWTLPQKATLLAG